MDSFLNGVQKNRLINGILAVIVLLAIFLAVKSLNTLKESSYIGRGVYPVNTITVSGKGEVFAIPDTGSLSFSVIEEGKTVKEAQDKATARINSALDAVKSMGVEEKDIKTVGYNSNPKYEYQQDKICAGGYCPPGRQILVGYEVNQTISVKIRKTADAGAILTKIGTLGVSNISGLSFVTEDMDKVQAEARDKAIIDAKEKAEVLAKSLGVKLVKIVSFNEGGNYPMPYAYGGAEKLQAMDASVANVPPQVPVGENEVVSNISITYEVE